MSSTPARIAHPRLTLAATICGSSLAFIDGSVVNVALPVLGRDLGAGPVALPWAINGYLLPLGALILLGGAAGDHYGRRRLFLLGLALFLLASIACALAPSLGVFLAARGVQGLGAAILMPNSLAILGASFSGDARGKAIGAWAAAGALIGALAPLLGGWLVDAVGWRWIFLLNLPIGGAAAWLAWRYVQETRETRAHPLDLGGAVFASLALGLLVWALTDASAAGALTPRASIAGLAGALLLGGFIAWEKRKADAALMPPAMFATPTFIGLTLLTFFLYASLGGLMVLLPFLLIQAHGWQALAAGASLLPVAVLIGVVSRVMGQLTAKIGGRGPLTLGAAIVGCGFLLYAFSARVEGFIYWRDVLPATLLVAVGMGICVAPLTTSVMTSVETDHVGAASGFNSAVARIGGLVATAALGFVFAAQDAPARFVAGFRVAMLVGAACAAIASISAWLLVRPERR